MKLNPQNIFLCLILLLAVCLVFPNLGFNCIWQDEAQTAVVAKNLLSCGYPAASDGRNEVSIFPDRRDVRDGIYIWQGWLPTYLCAASMAIFGCNTFGARFPFALSFVGLMAFSFFFLNKWRGLNWRSWLALLLIVTCIPLLLHARQSRYYILVPLLNLLMVDAYLSLQKGPRWRYVLWLVVWAVALANTFLPGLFVIAIALCADMVWRRASRRVWGLLSTAFGITMLINLPMFIFCRFWNRQFGPQPGFSGIDVFVLYLTRYILTLNNYFFPLILVIFALVIPKRLSGPGSEDKGLPRLFALICVAHLLGFAALSDFPFTRYLIGLTPFLMFLGADFLATLSFGRPWPAFVLGLAIILTNVLQALPLPLLRLTPLQSPLWTTAGINGRYLTPGHVGESFARGEIKQLINLPLSCPLCDYVRGLIHPPRGPIDLIVQYLNAHAKATDRVKIAYGDLPLMFHTRLNIVNSSDVGPPAPEWIIYRYFSPMTLDREFLRELSKHTYEKIILPFPDLQWNNRPDPLYHYNKTPSSKWAPPIVLFKRID